MTETRPPEPERHEPVPRDSTDEELTWSPQELPSAPTPPSPTDIHDVGPAPSRPVAMSPYPLTTSPIAPALPYTAPPSPARPLGLGWLWWLAGGCAVLLLCCVCSLLLGLLAVLLPNRSISPPPLPAPVATPRPASSVEDPAPPAAPSRPSNSPIGAPAADFTLQTLDGQTVRLSDLRGRPVILNFWASWCGPCREEMPLLSRTHDELKDSGVIILAVDVQESAATVQRYVDQNRLPFMIALDTDGQVSGQYRVRSLPTTYFIDAEGVIQSWQVGTLSKMLLDRHLDRIR